MAYIFVGLGNPGEEYELTRHNVGRIVLDVFRKKFEFSEWEKNNSLDALISEGKIGKEKIMLVEPETFMNKSGSSLKSLVTSVKKAEQLVVIHDELDLPIGRMKMSFNRSSGGHKGIDSVIKNVKTEAFIRIRVGISPGTAKGIVKKPVGEEAVGDFILGKFKPKELEELKKEAKVIAEGLEIFAKEGREAATMFINSN